VHDTALAIDFDRIQPGDRAVIVKRFGEAEVAAFAALSGDYNPLHMESEFAEKTRFGRRVVHGMLVASYVSTLVGMQLPGVGALWMQQSFRWRKPVFLGDTVEIVLEVTQKSPGARLLAIRVSASNQDGTAVMDGEGAVHVPALTTL
jgi:acyl dehydratase